MKSFLESSFKELYKSTVDAFPNTTMRQHATQPIIIENLKWTPFLGVKTLFIKAEARNEDRQYQPMILFKNVDYKKNEVKIKDNYGKNVSFGKLSLENTDILLRCGCKDFSWRFNFFDHVDKSLYGRKRKKYESKGGPPANPMEMPGMCKHLIKTFQALQEIGLFD